MPFALRARALTRLFATLGLWAGLALVTPQAHAQDGSADAPSDADRAAAQVLFDQGRALAKEDDWDNACVKFAESMRLDRAIGTQLNLANCYEKIGKTASAWINYVEAGSRARKAGQQKRADIAKERAEALEPKLSRLRIDVPFSLDGLVIKRDGDVVGAAQHNLPLPVDPGEHKIEASAPGKKTWRKTLTIADDASLAEIKVPELRDAPKEQPKPITAPKPAADDGSGMRVGGFIMGGLGIAGLAAGIAGGVLAMNNNDASLEHCLPDDANRCDPEGAQLRQDAFTMAHVSTGGFALAGVGLATAIVLLVAAPSGDEQDADPAEAEQARILVAPMLEATYGRPSGLMLQGSF